MNFNYPKLKNYFYLNANPFPHVVLRYGWNNDFLKNIEKEINSFFDWDGEKDFYGARKKFWCSDVEKLPPSAKRLITECSSPRFISWLENLTGEKSLIPDPYLEGGGIHCIKRGGLLKIHADFNWHLKLRLYRRINVLIYLNSNWKKAWGGDLQLAKKSKRILVQKKSLS